MGIQAVVYSYHFIFHTWHMFSPSVAHISVYGRHPKLVAALPRRFLASGLGSSHRVTHQRRKRSAAIMRYEVREVKMKRSLLLVACKLLRGGWTWYGCDVVDFGRWDDGFSKDEDV